MKLNATTCESIITGVCVILTQVLMKRLSTPCGAGLLFFSHAERRECGEVGGDQLELSDQKQHKTRRVNAAVSSTLVHVCRIRLFFSVSRRNPCVAQTRDGQKLMMLTYSLVSRLFVVHYIDVITSKPTDKHLLLTIAALKNCARLTSVMVLLF